MARRADHPATMWWRSFCTLPSRLLKSRKVVFICLSATEFGFISAVYPVRQWQVERGRLMPAMTCLCSVLSVRMSFPDSPLSCHPESSTALLPSSKGCVSLHCAGSHEAVPALGFHSHHHGRKNPTSPRPHTGTSQLVGLSSVTTEAQAGTCGHCLW